MMQSTMLIRRSCFTKQPYHAGAFGEVVLAEAWAVEIARHRGMKKAIVALTTRLAMIMRASRIDADRR